ncbi:lipopolysaccharide-induced tumor necrosis factor-alpha factor homolog [Chironomus tepperi]|uniref:lipopolysaccharide-induced tumor necrosis factor-alpha factor homolog n=1 Tax=Chironomus tepperi TaxID=113505 RepID=UPI00391F87F7
MDKGKQKTKFNEYDPPVMYPTTSYLPPPAYNPDMTQQAEPQKIYTVSHQTGVQTVMIQQSPITYGPDTIPMNCPWCKADISTEIKSVPTTKTHIIAVLLLSVCCCLIPYLCSSCQSQHHYCPNCKRLLGSYDG